MWRPVHFVAWKNNVSQLVKLPKCSYATSPPSGKGKRTFLTLIGATGVGMGVTIAYGTYDPKFRKLIEENIPFSDVVFRSITDLGSNSTVGRPQVPVISNKEVRDAAAEPGLLKKKQELKEVRAPVKVTENKDSKPEHASTQKPVALDKPAQNVAESGKPFQDENSLKNLLRELEQSKEAAVIAKEEAIKVIKVHAEKLYKALDSPQGVETEEYWREADSAGRHEAKALNSANEKVLETRSIIEKLKNEIKKYDGRSSVAHNAEDSMKKTEKLISEVEAEVSVAHAKSKIAAEYKDLVKKARDQFQNELKIVLPKYVHKKKDETMTEDELNLLIAHAHRRIENLQKDLARQQVTEKQRIEEAKILQKIDDEQSLEDKIVEELVKRQKVMEADFQKRLDVIREQFEADMRQQLRRQAAVHADHLQESLHIQQQELIRRQNIDLEEKLLQQKGIFISQISESMSKLKGIENFLRSRVELDEATQKAQALWLACQAMKNAMYSGLSETPKPLSKELAIVKAAAGERNSFLTTVLAGIPSQAIQRGVYTNEHLKQRFDKVKRICSKVAMIKNDNRSLYYYLLSYMQSFLLIDAAPVNIPQKTEDYANDSQLDTFGILNQVSYWLKHNDFEKALHYANLLSGEPLNVARDWISEVKLLLETSQAVDCLITYAAAVGLQAYH